ncbi:glycosyltransferase [Desulfoplanes sp. PS50]
MNIIFINATHRWGGVKTWTLDVARGLQALGSTCLIIGRPGPFVDRAREMGLEAQSVSFGPDFNPRLIATFLTLFKKRKTTHVMVNVGKDMRSAGIAAKMLGIPVIHRVGLPGDMLDTFKVRLLHKWIKPRILVPCEYIKTGLLEELPHLRPEEITVIHTGKIIADTPPDHAPGPVRFISTSQLNADKGHKDVLLALADLNKQGTDFRYHIVGTGREEKPLQELARTLGLTEKIIWHGFQQNVRALLRQADVYLLPSYNEGLPNSLLEAMAEGLICIARDVGGVKEIWPEWGGEFLVDETSGPEIWRACIEKQCVAPRTDLDQLKKNFLTQARCCCHITTQVNTLNQWLTTC